MTYNDGILTVYSVENIAEPGLKPEPKLTEKARYYYGYATLGITRYYTALEANQEVSAVVCIPDWNDVKNTDVVIMDEQPEITYRVVFVQPETDENGLRIMRLTLERISETYEIPETSPVAG